MWSTSRAARQSSVGSTSCSGARASRGPSAAPSKAGAMRRPRIPSARLPRSGNAWRAACRMSPETRSVLLYVGALVAAAALFLLAPGVDLWASGLFYRPGDGFFLANLGVVRALYRAVPWIVMAEFVGVPLLLLVGWWRGRAIAGIGLKQGAFVLLVLALGP